MFVMVVFGEYVNDMVCFRIDLGDFMVCLGDTFGCCTGVTSNRDDFVLLVDSFATIVSIVVLDLLVRSGVEF